MSQKPAKPVEGTKCQEQARGFPYYVPCDRPAAYIIGWENKRFDPAPMCIAHARYAVREEHGHKMTEGEVTGAPLAEPPAMASGSAEAARQAGDHTTQDEH